MKLYAAMMFGLALGAGIAIVLAARELEDAAPATIAPTPAPIESAPGATPPAGFPIGTPPGTTTGA
jgi:hypothetical protein